MTKLELSGDELDYAVAQCEGLLHDDGSAPAYFQPSIDWEQGGAIIECEKIELVPKGDTWDAYKAGQHVPQSGATPLIAAMRCYVASKTDI